MNLHGFVDRTMHVVLKPELYLHALRWDMSIKTAIPLQNIAVQIVIYFVIYIFLYGYNLEDCGI